jgi:hypothetical protein
VLDQRWVSDPHAILFDVEFEPASYERAVAAQQPWPAPCVLPPLPVLDRGALVDLQNGDREADWTEAQAAAAARSRGALDLAVGDGLAAMQRGERLIRLGYSCLGDYAREVLGILERTAQDMAHLSRELAKRPLLRAAVWKGEVCVSRAEAVMTVAIGEAEAKWVDLARDLSVRTLEMLVRAERGAPVEEEEWRRFVARLSPEQRAIVNEALAVAGKFIGEGAPRGQRLEALAQEYLGGHPVEAGEADRPVGALCHARRTDVDERREAQLEVETACWSMLRKVPDASVPETRFDETASPAEIDAELRRLSTLRSSWDDLFAHAALAIKASGIWRFLGFATFGHYCVERLGLSERTVEQRVALEKRLWEVPVLREAFARRQLSYEQARLLSRLPDEEIAAWIPHAQELTCIELRRALEREKEAQLCAAGKLVAKLPEAIALTLATAFKAVRAAENPRLSDGACLVVLAQHYLEVWKPQLPKRKTRSQRIRERDLGRCQVPGCSRRAAHAHHVEPRSHLGPDTDENQVGICAHHHLVGIEKGYVRVNGTAPNGLVWELGGRIWMGPERWEKPVWVA